MKIQEEEIDQAQKAAIKELEFCNKKQKCDETRKKLQMQSERANDKTTKQ